MTEIVPIQPLLPVEGPWTQAELSYADDEPPGLFPENQDSNWGVQRRIFSKQQQDLINQLNVIYSELFIKTSTEYLDVWEAQLGLPVNPAIPVANRRTRVAARMKKGAFTDVLRNSVIEPFLIATFGEPVVLVPEGISLTAAGIPLYGESVAVTGSIGSMTISRITVMRSGFRLRTRLISLRLRESFNESPRLELRSPSTTPRQTSSITPAR